VIHCFPNKPAAINRADLTNTLNEIREFRNRVYHNENICFDNITIDFTHALKVKKEIYDLLEWMDVDLKKYVLQFDSVDSAITRALTV
jgi:chloramphenicol O-acetyltransferase